MARRPAFKPSFAEQKRMVARSLNFWSQDGQHPEGVMPTVAAKRMRAKHEREGLSELQHQIRVITWWDKHCGDYGLPPFALHSVPNGSSLSGAITGANLKRAGMRDGVEDLFMSVPRNGWHGLYIEMKTDGGHISDDQHAMAEFHFSQKYQSHICWSHDEAIEQIISYLTPDI